MVLRFLFRYLANNEQLVNKLADSNFMRKAARTVVYLFTRTKILAEKELAEGKLKDINLEQLKEYRNKIENNLKKIRDDLEKKSKN